MMIANQLTIDDRNIFIVQATEEFKATNVFDQLL
jgi:hypothetical protein